MRKQDIIIIAVLFALLMAWPYIDKQWIAPKVAAPVPGRVQTNAPASEETPPAAAAPVAPAAAESPAAPAAVETPPAGQADPHAAAAPEQVRKAPEGPERLVAVTNSGATFTFSTRHGGVVSAEFRNYRATSEKDSGPVVLNFSNAPAASFADMQGYWSAGDFSVVSADGASLVMEAAGAGGVKLVRKVALNDLNQLAVTDLFTNSAGAACSIPAQAIRLGSMEMLPGEYRMSGMNYLGIDAMAASGGEGVTYWGGQLAKLFKNALKEGAAPLLPRTIAVKKSVPIDWLAVKNKFFVQILAAEGGSEGYFLMAGRDLVRGEEHDPELAPKSAEIKTVSAAAVMSVKTLGPGEVHLQSFKLYIGPKKFSILRTLGLHQEEVMEFGGFWPSLMTPISKFLLTVLNLTHDYIPNYGLAIIILTVLIRIVFWPLMHKSTESMKKMQQLQPLMAELKAKHKDNPRKMQEETMALYRKHKINPVSGCLPMLIQIPVFIALFIVLRSAIELRFAPFLWISDLSSPERLFADILPIPLNILPIFMAVTQAWQQSLMPATDPNQQKMMLYFMPAMMLVMFYMMPSALVLYWSANQCIVIFQQLSQKFFHKDKNAAAPAAGKK